jgi:hypothetical protein
MAEQLKHELLAPGVFSVDTNIACVRANVFSNNLASNLAGNLR